MAPWGCFFTPLGQREKAKQYANFPEVGGFQAPVSTRRSEPTELTARGPKDTLSIGLLVDRSAARRPLENELRWGAGWRRNPVGLTIESRDHDIP